MLKQIKNFGAAVTRVEAEKILGYANGTLKTDIDRGRVPKRYLRQSGSTWLISLEWIEQKMKER